MVEFSNFLQTWFLLNNFLLFSFCGKKICVYSYTPLIIYRAGFLCLFFDITFLLTIIIKNEGEAEEEKQEIEAVYKMYLHPQFLYLFTH